MSINQLVDTIKANDQFTHDTANENINRILGSARAYLGMEIAFASRITQTFVTIENVNASSLTPFNAGDTFLAEDVYCKRVLDGRLPSLIHDAAAFPESAKLACTQKMPIGAYLSVPLRLSDGSIYGTFSCFSTCANYSLNDRDVTLLQAFADLAAGQIEIGLSLFDKENEVKERIFKTIHDGSIEVVYQPIYDLETARIVGLEALARFSDSDLRGPDEWFAEASSIGMGLNLELSAIGNAVKALSRIPEEIFLAVNVSPLTLLSDQLRHLLEGIQPGRLVIEVTEHSVISDFELLKHAMKPLRGRIRIAIDDAGAGYSGFRHILGIQPDIIKLDMNLTRGIDTDPVRVALTKAMAAFAKDIGSLLIAEGIETNSELTALKEIGVPVGQGYYLSRPMPISDLTAYLNAQQKGQSKDSSPCQ